MTNNHQTQEREMVADQSDIADLKAEIKSLDYRVGKLQSRINMGEFNAKLDLESYISDEIKTTEARVIAIQNEKVERIKKAIAELKS
jgi:polyhydroxyalkanoate synthesis regulator phasin